MAKKKEIDDILKVPCCLIGVKYRKPQDVWDLTMEVDPSNLEHLKPLMDMMQQHFELLLVKVENPNKDKGGAEDIKL